MDLDFNADEEAILGRVGEILDISRASAPDRAAGFDQTLMQALRDDGFLSLAGQGAQGRINAMLVIQEVARAGRLVPAGVQVMLAPLLFGRDAVGPIAIRREESKAAIPFACHADSLVVLGARQARAYRVQPRQARAVHSNYGVPRGHCALQAVSACLGTWPADIVRRRWQLGLAGEILGAMAGALDHLVAYLTQRRQFGRELGSFQAVQHRLAELAVTLEALRCLALEAAWADTDELAATAAAYAATAAHAMCLEAHQLSGAMGFTIESGLYAWTLRLQALSVEAGGARWHAMVAAAAHWDAAREDAAALGHGAHPSQSALVAQDLQVE